MNFRRKKTINSLLASYHRLYILLSWRQMLRVTQIISDSYKYNCNYRSIYVFCRRYKNNIRLSQSMAKCNNLPYQAHLVTNSKFSTRQNSYACIALVCSLSMTRLEISNQVKHRYYLLIYPLKCCFITFG